MTVCDTTAAGSRPPTPSARTGLCDPLIMRLSWSQHLAAARTLELAGREQTGTALALMGMALVMLLQDLEGEADRPSQNMSAKRDHSY
jgi:membrane protease subunit (stomatin/prohibitin family)